MILLVILKLATKQFSYSCILLLTKDTHTAILNILLQPTNRYVCYSKAYENDITSYKMKKRYTHGCKPRKHDATTLKQAYLVC